MRVLVAGFHHQTNSFAPGRTGWPAFESGIAHPVASRGEPMLHALRGTAWPLAGFLQAAQAQGWSVVPSIWAGALPGGPLTRDAFERIAGAVLEDLREAGAVDAVYLDLQGAAMAEQAEDAEGELLARLRELLGPRVPIVASLALHANVTERMLRLASAMTTSRSYPAVDLPETGARAAALLQSLRSSGDGWQTRHERLPFLLPLLAQCTLHEPASGAIALLRQLEADHGVALGFAMGFPASDFAECGPVVFGHGTPDARVQEAVQALADAVAAQRSQWRVDVLSAREAVDRALAIAQTEEAPVMIADAQDDPGAGGDAHTTGLLHALLAARAGARWPGRVALGLLHDPQGAASAHAAGKGSLIELRLGRAVPTFSGGQSDAPVLCRCVVRAVSDGEGEVTLEGPLRAGATLRLGPSACVDVDGLLVLLTSSRVEMLDRALYRFLGVQPERMKLLVHKSGVHWHMAFDDIASATLVAKAAGPMAADPADLPWRRLPSQVARRP